MRRRLTLAALVVAVLAVLPSCGANGGRYAIVQTSQDPGMVLRYDWISSEPIEPGQSVRTACWAATSYQVNPGWQCRSVHGVQGSLDEDINNWVVTPLHEGALLEVAGHSASNAGLMLVMEDGRIWEGCIFRWGSGDFLCDYYSKKWSDVWPQHPCSGWCWSYVLGKTWDWLGYLGDSVECASSLTASLIYGHTWTLPMTLSCARTPMSSPGT